MSKNINNNFQQYNLKNNKKKKKFDFNKKKENTIKSLNEVESFLRNFRNIAKCAKFYKLLK